MPFVIPTLEELANRSAGAFRANLKGSDARLWPNNVAVSSKVMAGTVWEAFAFLDYISRQHVAHLADGVWLERKGLDYGIARLPASYAEGDALISGDANVPVPSGLVLERADGVVYDSLAATSTDATGHAVVRVRARVLGKAGNAVPGVALTLTGAVDRIAVEHEVASTGIGGGSEVEGDESLRARLLFRLRNPPHGGAAHDYVIWVREVAGVTRVYVDPVSVANRRATIGIWFLMDDTYPHGIPLAADVVRVSNYLDAVRPGGSRLTIRAPVPVPVNITIDNLAPDTTTVRDAVRAELADLFRTRMAVCTVSDPFALRVSKIWEAISVATGEDSHSLVLPASDVTLQIGEIPVLGTVTFA